MENTFYLHSEPKLGRHRVTVAGVIENLNAPQVALRVGVSICSPKDQFIKAVGRQRAQGRAMSKTAIVANFTKPITEVKTEEINAVLAQYAEKALAQIDAGKQISWTNL